MAAIARTTDLDQRVVEQAAAWYPDNPVPEPFRGIDPAVVRRAAGLSAGDWRRCLTDGDGTIVVCKHPVW